MKKRQSLFLLFFLGLLSPVFSPQLAHTVPVAEEVLSAMVTVHAEVPASARTAQFLGEQRIGSGVIIDTEGHILTIGYLVMEAHRVEVTGMDGKRVRATVVAHDTQTGFGLLRANEPLNATPMPFGTSADLAERTEVIIASDSTAASVRPTLVTSRREFAGYWEYLLEDAIFTAPPHPRYAGAALIGPDGKLLGIGSLLVNDALPGRGSLTGNMFVPIDHLKPILTDLIRTGRTRPPRGPGSDSLPRNSATSLLSCLWHQTDRRSKQGCGKTIWSSRLPASRSKIRLTSIERCGRLGRRVPISPSLSSRGQRSKTLRCALRTGDSIFVQFLTRKSRTPQKRSRRPRDLARAPSPLSITSTALEESDPFACYRLVVSLGFPSMA